MRHRAKIAVTLSLCLLQGCGGSSGGGSSATSASASTPVTIAEPTTTPATTTPAAVSPTPATEAPASTTPTSVPPPSLPSEIDTPYVAVADTTGFKCPTVVAMPSVMGIEGRYVGGSSDPTWSTLDEDKVAAQQPERAKFDKPTTTINSLSIMYAREADEGRKQAIGRCLGVHFAALPANDAMTSADSEEDNLYRVWMVSALAVSWLRAERDVKRSDDVAAVRGWFATMARQIRSFESAARNAGVPLSNHDYWGAAAVAGAARVSRNSGDFEWGYNMMLAGLARIDSDGLLAKEMTRGSKAFHYHLFSAVPLAATAILTGSNIETLAGGAYGRLANRLVSEAESTTGGLITSRTGVQQEAVREGQFLLLAALLKRDTGLAARLTARAEGQNTKIYFLGTDIGYLIDAAGSVG